MESKLGPQSGRSGRILRPALPVLLFAAALPLPGQQGQTPAPTVDPATLPARDQHQDVLIAVDPYMTKARSKKEFGEKNPYTAGILAVQVYVRNDSDRTVVLSPPPTEFRLAGPNYRKHEIVPLASQDTAVHLRHPYKPVLTEQPDYPGAVCWPRGIGRREEVCIIPMTEREEYLSWLEEQAVSKLAHKLESEMLPSSVAPRSTVRGFLFYDINGQFQVVADASIFFPDVRRENPREDLLFFEIPLGPAVKSPTPREARRRSRETE